MSQQASKRRGRPKGTLTEAERLARQLASQRARAQRYYQRQHQQATTPHHASAESQETRFVHYHYQPHPPAIPSTTNPIIGLHLEPNLEIPVPSDYDPLPAVSTYIDDYDEPSEIKAGPAVALSWDPPVWNHDENSRARHSSSADEEEQRPLFDDSQKYLELISQDCDIADAANASIVHDQASLSDLDARDEELQDLVNKVQQVLLTSNREASIGEDDQGDEDDEESVQGATNSPQVASTMGRNPKPTCSSSTSRTKSSSPSQCRNILTTWLQRSPSRMSDGSSKVTVVQTHDHDGFILLSAAGLAIFTQAHPEFVNRPRETVRNYGVEWSYHGLYTWNLRRRLERQDYLVTEDVLCGIRLSIELSDRRDVMTLVRTIQLGELDSDSIQLTQTEINNMQKHDIIIIPIFRQGIDNSIGHWSLAIYQRTQSCFFLYDSLHPDSSCHSTLGKIHAAVRLDSTPMSIYDIPATQQVYGWTCGLIVVECARRFVNVWEGRDLPLDQLGSLDWTQQEPYLSGIQEPELREISAISYWIELISQYLGATSSNAAADKNIEMVSQAEGIEIDVAAAAVAADEEEVGDVPGAEEPADPALLLFQEWNGRIGCTSKQHDDDHDSQLQEAEKERGVALTCSSLLDIAKRLEGMTIDGGTEERLPSVLDPANDFLRPGPRENPSEASTTRYSKSCKMAMEGTMGDEQSPPYLCMHSHHGARLLQGNSASSSYDVDSTCSFLKSLGAAQLGLQWYTQPHVPLNLVDNVHLSLEIPTAHGKADAPITQPLHNIPNYCFGRVVGLIDTYIWIFFPALFRMPLSDPYTQTCIPKEKYVHWYEEVIMPAIEAVINDNNILQYIPKTNDIASSDCSAPREALATLPLENEEVDDMQEQLGENTHRKRREPTANSSGLHRKQFYVTLQPRYLANLWTEIQARAAPFQEYAGLQLYMASKNTKLIWMRPTLESTLEEWRIHWDSAIDETYIDSEATYIDIGRQLTPAEKGPEGHVLLWRRCCLDRLWRRRLQWSRVQNRLSRQGQEAKGSEPADKRQRPPIRRTNYPFVTLRDSRDMTITPEPGSWELQNGLVYSQFYHLIKVPFDAAKRYPFQNRHTESMALDPSYLRDQKNSTRGSHAHQNRVQCAYRLSKLRIHRNIPTVNHDEVDDGESTSHQFTYGIRAEDRVSLALLRRIMDLFSSIPSQPEDAEEESLEDPFFAISSQTMAQFLRASINRYCFLFEHIKVQTGLKYSLPETIVMATALRGLRFSYDSSLITSESVLWGDRWTSTQRTRTKDGEMQTTEVQREGLGLAKTCKAHGFGWWVPGKFDWDTWRFHSEVGDRLAVGNNLLRQDYKRQWRVLKDIRDIHVRMWQAQSWAGRHRVRENVVARRLWFEYLHSTVVELFQRDVWRTALKSIKWKTGSDVNDEAMIKYPDHSPPAFSYDGLIGLFHDRQRDISHTRPHLITGNKLRSTSMIDLFDDLFSPNCTGTSMNHRRGWSSLPYRIATRRSIELVEMALGSKKGAQWYMELRRIVLLTHWILPWPSDSQLLTTTKESQAAGLKRRLTWASVIFACPSTESTDCYEPLVPTRKVDDTDNRISTQTDLSRMLSEVCRRQFGDQGWKTSADNTNHRYYWSTRDLVKSTRDSISLHALQLGRAVEPGQKGWIFPIAETGQPPQLRMVKRIRDKTLDELDLFFSELLQTSNTSTTSQSTSPTSRQNDITMYSPVSQPRKININAAVVQSNRSCYLSWLRAGVMRTAGEREKLRKHFKRCNSKQTRKIADTESNYSEDTSATVQTNGSDEWRPQKRLRKEVRERQQQKAPVVVSPTTYMGREG